MKKTEELVSRLIEIIQQETYNFGEFLALLQEERRLLEEGRLAEMERIVSTQEHVVACGQMLEEERRAVTAQLAETFSLPTDQFSLGALLPRVGSFQSGRLAELQGQLVDLYQKIQRAKHQIALLLRQSPLGQTTTKLTPPSMPIPPRHFAAQ